MRWKGREQSKNIEDRRGMRTGMAVGGGGLGLIILMVIATLLGADPRRLMQQAQNAQQQQQQVQRSGANGQIDMTFIRRGDDDPVRLLLQHGIEVLEKRRPVSGRCFRRARSRIDNACNGESIGRGNGLEMGSPDDSGADNGDLLVSHFMILPAFRAWSGCGALSA